MTTISIPKENVLELIRNSYCKYYDYTNYWDLEIKTVDTETSLKEFESGSLMLLSNKHLSSLLFDRVVKVSDELLITVS